VKALIRGYQITDNKGTVLNVSDVAEMVFCPYTALIKYMKGIRRNPPKMLYSEAYHKIHFIVHRFGVSVAEKVILEAKDQYNIKKDKNLKEFMKWANAIIKSHKDTMPVEDIQEKVTLSSRQLGMKATIPLVEHKVPIIEVFFEKQSETIPLLERIKLTAYSLLLEAEYQIDIDTAYIEYPFTKMRKAVEITSDMRERTLKHRDLLENLMRTGELNAKVSVNPIKCRECLYHEDCDYRKRRGLH